MRDAKLAVEIRLGRLLLGELWLLRIEKHAPELAAITGDCIRQLRNAQEDAMLLWRQAALADAPHARASQSLDLMLAEQGGIFYGYGIMDRLGAPWWDDGCVCEDAEPMQETVTNLNDDAYDDDPRRPYRVVRLYALDSLPTDEESLAAEDLA